MLILVLHLAPEKDLAIHHLHLYARIADGFLDSLFRAFIVAGDVHIVFLAAVIGPHQKGCGACFFPYHQVIIIGKETDIRNVRISDCQPGNAGVFHVPGTVHRYIQYICSKHIARCANHGRRHQEADSF